MNISLIVAMDKKRGIGFENTLPWAGKIPRDMAHFRDLTTGRPVIMGRKTFESIGRALPKRKNIVLTRDKEWRAPGVRVAHSLKEALQFAEVNNPSDVFVIGGSELFKEALPIAKFMYITEIDGNFTCDTFFPEYDKKSWMRTSMQVHQADERNIFKLRFLNFINKTA